MTAYSAIADSEIDPESPGTASLFTKLRNNPLAIAEGDATAPEIDGQAITTNTIPGASIIDNGITASKLPTPATGSYRQDQSNDGGTTNSTSLVKVGEIYCPRAGTYNVRMNLNFSGGKGGGTTGYGRIYVDGVAVGTLRSTTSSSTFDEDVTVAAGEVIQIYCRTTNAADDTTGSIIPRVATSTLLFPAGLED